MAKDKITIKGTITVGTHEYEFETELRHKSREADKSYLLDDLTQEVLNEIRMMKSTRCYKNPG